MDVAVIQIGNSDDKLTQYEWSFFVSATHELILALSYPIYFHGTSVGSAPWQNACWVLDMRNVFDDVTAIDILRRELGKLAEKYRQDSIALTIGDTELVRG